MPPIRPFPIALAALLVTACGDATKPEEARRFDAVSVNGDNALEAWCPPPDEGGEAGVGLARPSSLVLEPDGRFTWTFTVGAFASSRDGQHEAQSMTTMESGTYRIRRDSLLLAFSGGMPLTEPVGHIAGENVRLYVTQPCLTDPSFPGAPLEVLLGRALID